MSFNEEMKKHIEKAEQRAAQEGKDVLVIHDEREGISLYPVHCSDRMYMPKYVLHVAKFSDIKRRRQTRHVFHKGSLVMQALTQGEKHGNR